MSYRTTGELKFRSASERIASQHQRLESFYSIISDALARGDTLEADAGLTSFIDALDAHFTLEEFEWFPALARTRSTLRAEVAVLSSDHVHFRQELLQVRKRLRAREFEASVARFDRFLTELARHDEREERILAESADRHAFPNGRIAPAP